MYPIQLSEQRQQVRYRLKDPLFATIQGDVCDRPACLVDLNHKGVGFYAKCKERELRGKIIVFDLKSDSNHTILRSLSGRVVFSSAKPQNENDRIDTPQRYGLQFVNLSALENRLLKHITKKYALHTLTSGKLSHV